MNFIKTLLLKWVGLEKAVEALDAEDSKAYAAGAEKIMAGAASIATGLGMYAAQFVAAKGASEYLAILQGALHNPATLAITGGWLSIKSGKADIGLRHAILKASSPAAP